jgi:hypothetical protein
MKSRSKPRFENPDQNPGLCSVCDFILGSIVIKRPNVEVFCVAWRFQFQLYPLPTHAHIDQSSRAQNTPEGQLANQEVALSDRYMGWIFCTRVNTRKFKNTLTINALPNM